MSSNMNNEDILPVLNRLLIKLDLKNGAMAVGQDFFSALKETVLNFAGDKTKETLMAMLKELHDLLLAGKPRMAHLIHYLQHLMIKLNALDNSSFNVHRLITILETLEKEAGFAVEKAIEHGRELLQDDEKSILIHSYSNTISLFLSASAELPNKPKVVVAYQDPVKTHRLIRRLKELEYNFFVVSEFSVVHIIDQIDFALFGALTLNKDEELVVGPGSASLIAQLKDAGVGVYPILTTAKFSFWREKTEKAFKEKRIKVLGDIEYEKVVFSHDFVKLSHTTGIITERGILPPHQARKVFGELQKEFEDREQIIKTIAR